MSHPEAELVSCVNFPKSVSHTLSVAGLGDTVSKWPHRPVSLGSIAPSTLEDPSHHVIVLVVPRRFYSK